MRRLMVLLTFSLLGLTACATEYQVVQFPLRDADLYPRSQTKAGITVAIDEITDSERVKTYFGVDLLKAKILPVNIIVSNHGDGRYIIKPSDILLMEGNEVLDPMPVEAVAEAAKEEHALVSDKTARQVDTFFFNLTLQETVLAPRESYQGILFFKTRKGPEEGEDEERYFIIRKLFREGSLKLYIAVTNLETGERVHFGPVSLSGI